MKRKLIATFLLLIVLPTALLFVYVVTQSQHMAVDNAQRSTLRTMEQTAREVENLVHMVEYASDVLYQDPVLRAFVGDREEDDLRTMLRQVDSLRSAMSSSESALGLHRIRLYLHDEKMAARERVHFFSLRDAAQQDWYEDVVLDSGLGSWSGVYYDRSMVDAAPQWLISYRRIARATNAPDARDGILSMDLGESSLYARIRTVPTRTTEAILLLDGSGNVLSSGDKEALGQRILPEELLAQMQQEGTGYRNTELDGGEKTVTFTRLTETGWLLVDVIDRGMVLENYSYWNDIRLIVIVLLVFIFFVGASYFELHIFNQELARRITAVAKRLEGGTLSPGKQGETDLDKAERLVMEVLEKNRRLTEDNYQARLQERKAQLLALQAQINPHFLCNTLECINWMAFRYGAADISQAITALARYFRLTLNDGKDVVSVADEIELAKTYLAIQNIRFESKIQVEITVPEELQHYAIPKLALQPFVENAVIYGIRKTPQRSGTIWIAAEIGEESIVITVRDNGIGMSGETLSALAADSRYKDHYGIYNVRERLRLFYGEGTDVTVTSQEEQGTCVKMTIGKKELEEERY